MNLDDVVVERAVLDMMEHAEHQRSIEVINGSLAISRKPSTVKRLEPSFTRIDHHDRHPKHSEQQIAG